MLAGTGFPNGVSAGVSPIRSGLIIDGDVKDLSIVTAGKKRILLAAINNEKMKALSIKNK